MDRIRVLLVDDNGAIRDLLRAAAEMSPRFEIVGEARDGLEAVQAAAWLKPDLILLDVAMPVMDGLTALPRVQDQAPDAKVVLLTGFDASVLDVPPEVQVENKSSQLVFLFDRLATATA